MESNARRSYGWTFWSTAVLIVVSLYGGSYMALAEPDPYTWAKSGSLWRSTGGYFSVECPVQYSTNGQVNLYLEPFFRPAHWLDLRLRPDHWDLAQFDL